LPVRLITSIEEGVIAMRVRLAIAALLATAALPFEASGAQAGHFYYDPYAPTYRSYYAGPQYLPPPQFYFWQQQRRWNRAWQRRRPLFGYSYRAKPYLFEEEPQYEPDQPSPPARQKKKTLALPASKPSDKGVASQDKSASQPTKKVASTAKSSDRITCDKAGEIVSGYGFSEVKPTSCEGDTFSFAAAREGKPYAIKMSAASGELTEVKKVK